MRRAARNAPRSSGEAQRPPQGKPWIWITCEVLDSDSWNDLGINARRLIDFLLVEHMAHGGRRNGRLKAPHRQLVRHGIAARHVANAIRAAEASGLVIARRGGMRVATTYTLAWLPLPDGRTAPPLWLKHESAAPSVGSAASPSAGRRHPSVSRKEGRWPPSAASPSEGPLKNSNQDGSLPPDTSRGDEDSPTEEPFDAGTWDE